MMQGSEFLSQFLPICTIEVLFIIDSHSQTGVSNSSYVRDKWPKFFLGRSLRIPMSFSQNHPYHGMVLGWVKHLTNFIYFVCSLNHSTVQLLQGSVQTSKDGFTSTVAESFQIHASTFSI